MDYDEQGAQAHYVVSAFRGHPAFELSPHCYFEFNKSGWRGVFWLDVSGIELSKEEIVDRGRLIDGEGFDPLDQDLSELLAAEVVDRFGVYRPERPPRLYVLQRDEDITSLETDGDEMPKDDTPMARLSPQNYTIGVGKHNFVIDSEGWLIVDVKHHHLLSGGLAVGGAGHLVTGPDGRVCGIHLNFSGHYRPRLTAGYAQYVFRVIRSHPLIDLNPDCAYKGRFFKAESDRSTVLDFDLQDLTGDVALLEEVIETGSWL
jgi:hypothetical protein